MLFTKSKHMISPFHPQFPRSTQGTPGTMTPISATKKRTEGILRLVLSYGSQSNKPRIVNILLITTIHLEFPLKHHLPNTYDKLSGQNRSYFYGC